MSPSDIILHRLINQQIAESKFKRPHEIVSWLVAMQAQEYAMAKWSIGLRLQNLNDADVEAAFDRGSILRTHLLRPTWHFVAPADIRWLLKLTAPRVNQASAFMYRQYELDNKIFNKSNNAIAKALEGKHLQRTALKKVLEGAKISVLGFRMVHLLMRAELDGIICSGPREGKQFTYALLEERVPPGKDLSKAEALAELAHRYFRSRGPATLHDFATWSGLTVKEATAGIESLSNKFVRENEKGKEYIFIPTRVKDTKAYFEKIQKSFLMPDYDEYGMGYKDRSAIFNPDHAKAVSRGNPVFNRMIILDGRIAGTWKRTIKDRDVIIETVPFVKLNKAGLAAVKKANLRYSAFVGKALDE